MCKCNGIYLWALTLFQNLDIFLLNTLSRTVKNCQSLDNNGFLIMNKLLEEKVKKNEEKA